MQLKTQFNKRNGINARALVVFAFVFVIVIMNVFVVLVGFRVGFRVGFVFLVGVVITFVVLVGGGLGFGIMFANENIAVAVAVAYCMRESKSFI